MMTSTLIVGCDLPEIFQSKENLCLKSEKFNFNDPDSVVFIANLGTRNSSTETFWVRYKAKNGYGAYKQANMACFKQSDGHYVRDKTTEFLAIQDVKIDYFKRRSKSYDESTLTHDGTVEKLSESELQDMAHKFVYESTSNLPQQKDKDSEINVITRQKVSSPTDQGKVEQSSKAEDMKSISLKCYDIGHRFGHTAASIIKSKKVNPSWDVAIPDRCLKDPETDKGILAGTRAVG